MNSINLDDFARSDDKKTAFVAQSIIDYCAENNMKPSQVLASDDFGEILEHLEDIIELTFGSEEDVPLVDVSTDHS